MLQKQAEERKLEAHRLALEKAPPKVSAAESWPAPVQQRYLQLLAARLQDVPAATRALAELGEDAAPALREIAASQTEPQHKRALSSMLLVQLRMFRPAKLEPLALDASLPFAQRAAIDALIRLGRPEGERVLERVATGLQKHVNTRALAAELPGLRRRETHPWNYSAAQLQVLDRVLAARQPAELKAALEAITDLSLQAGSSKSSTRPWCPCPFRS